MRARATLRARVALSCSTVLIACASANSGATSVSGSGATASSSISTSASSSGSASGSSSSGLACIDGPSPDSCPEDAKNYIYMVAQQGALFRFSPSTQKVELVDKFHDCPPASPFALTIDRGGRGWAQFEAEPSQMQHLDLGSTTCSPSCVPHTPECALAFAGDGAGGEMLYLAPETDGGSLQELLRVDIVTGKATSVGFSDIAPVGVDMTGTSDGRLFQFVKTSATTPPLLAEVDPATGKLVSRTTLPMPPIEGAWAFAFWGGSFYFFTDDLSSFGSRIDRWDPGTQTLTLVMKDLGVDISGAGVSTCAPLTPPA